MFEQFATNHAYAGIAFVWLPAADAAPAGPLLAAPFFCTFAQGQLVTATCSPQSSRYAGCFTRCMPMPRCRAAAVTQAFPLKGCPAPKHWSGAGPENLRAATWTVSSAAEEVALLLLILPEQNLSSRQRFKYC
ncbi:hypothetical protein BEN49_04395 [Hymenobacter coccineus]|uniref:Uncharacterized protein n=1 Tax=Hymenobacter coccineus TaxID=1908235 RepID=A0A1G1TLA9_9BACT|nr:hypothetical protein BEN49_04395 [Hymenobacter coccineus]